MHDSQRMYFNSFGDPLTFPLAPPAGQIFYFYQVHISRAATWPGTKFGTGIQPEMYPYDQRSQFSSKNALR